MMSSKEIVEKFTDFYAKRGHSLIPNVSLVPENDPTLLFVNSGMFPLVPYLSGQAHPQGKRLMNVQRSLRFEDMELIGDRTHTVAFHMLGNWSLGDYFKKEQLPWVYEFMVEELGIDPHRLFATVFAGEGNVPADTESIKILQEIFKKYDIEAKEGERIFAFGKKSNWWKRGEAVGELGGPDSEVFYYLGEGSGIGKNPEDFDDEFLEIGNSVFMQYRKTQEGWEELSQKNVDFGGGLERIAWVVQQKQDIFETDNFYPIIEAAEQITGKNYHESPEVTRSMRILADHMRASVFLAMDGVTPSNKDQGYVLRRLLRRMTRAGRNLGVNSSLSTKLVKVTADSFSWIYPDLLEQVEHIANLFEAEESKFSKTLERGQKELDKKLTEKEYSSEELAKIAFDLYQSMGFPSEIFLAEAVDRGIKVDHQKFNENFDEIFLQHQSGSRAGAEMKFKGGLADQSEQVIKYHTATHLIHQALRTVLGEEVSQQGSNITGERLRFDFNYPQKLTTQETADVEALVNQKISESLPVKFETMPIEDAKKTGAVHFFGEKYGEQVNVYYIGESMQSAFSKEFCGGPHVSNTNELSQLEIFKQESIGKGKQRIYARFKEAQQSF